MQLLALGLNHTTAPVSVRSAVSFSPEEIPGALASLKEMFAGSEEGGIREAMILSTCNRTEFFLAAENPEAAFRSLCRFVTDRKHIDMKEFLPHTYRYQQSDVARHTYRVASGLDSMVLGETQIVGQMKKAWREAREAGALGTGLSHLFDSTFSAAKDVRTVTAIGSQSVSLAAAGVRLAEHLFGDLSKENLLFVGAGEMIDLCAAHFCAQKPKKVTIANRTLERGAALAKKYGAEAAELKNLPEIIAGYDIVVTCTASSLPIIGLGMVQSAVAQRRHRPMIIIDLAVPRDVEPEIAKLEDVYVYTVDDLGKVVASGRESRRVAVGRAEEIIEEKVKEFDSWLVSRAAVADIQALRARAEALREEELGKALKHLDAGQDPKAVLESLSRALTNKFTHDPIAMLRNSAGLSEEERIREAAVLRGFFRSRNSRS